MWNYNSSHVGKHLPTTLRLSLSQSSTAETHSEREITLSSCASHTSGLMRTSPNSNPPTLTSDTSLKRSSMPFKTKNPGSELSKSTVCSKSRINSPSSPSDGHHLVSQDPKDPTIAQLVPTTATVEPSWTPITRLVFSLELKFQDPMPKLCQVNGNSKSDPV